MKEKSLNKLAKSVNEKTTHIKTLDSGKKLKGLNLDITDLHNYVDNVSLIRHLNDCIKMQPYLFELELKAREMDYDDTKFLKEVILLNKQIKKLRLIIDGISIEGLGQLSEIISYSEHLSSVEINSNVFNREILSVLGLAVSANDSLQEIKINTNKKYTKLDVALSNLLMRMINKNISLREIDFNNPKCEASKKRILSRNKFVAGERGAYNQTVKTLFILYKIAPSNLSILPFEIINIILCFLKYPAMNVYKRVEEYDCTSFKNNEICDLGIYQWRCKYNKIFNPSINENVYWVEIFYNEILNNVVRLDYKNAHKYRNCIYKLATHDSLLNKGVLEKSIICSLYLALGFYTKDRNMIYDNVNCLLAKKYCKHLRMNGFKKVHVQKKILDKFIEALSRVLTKIDDPGDDDDEVLRLPILVKKI